MAMSKKLSEVFKENFGNFDRTAMIGLALLIASFLLGALTRNSAYITNESLRRLPFCDSYITWLCIPTAYVSIPLGVFDRATFLVINITSFLSSIILFVLGVVLVRK